MNITPISETAAEDAAENLRKWDKGFTVWSVEMGGLGPSYEQCIQILTMEIIRRVLKHRPTDQDGWNNAKDAAVVATSENSYSGTQVGVAYNLAFMLLTRGWDEVLRLSNDRLIQICRQFPTAPVTEIRE